MARTPRADGERIRLLSYNFKIFFINDFDVRLFYHDDLNFLHVQLTG